MSETTGIEWTDSTWNPIRGCSRVSEGCRHCYAEAVAARFSGPGLPYEGLARSTSGGPRWTGAVRMIEKHLEDPPRWKEPRRIFVNSMSDLFHEDLPDEAIDQVFAVMAGCRRHTFQILTKRPARMFSYLAPPQTRLDVGNALTTRIIGRRLNPTDIRHHLTIWPLPNVWLGVSVEHQAAAEERIPQLLATPAAVRFISAEPLLGPVDLVDWLPWGEPDEPAKLDWVIVGGESGPQARPMHPSWAREIHGDCLATGVPMFFKQWGEWEPVRALYGGDEDLDNGRGELYALEAGGCFYGPGSPALQPQPGAWLMERVGKKRAGRLLDGREWSEFPS